jgi:Gpi18-like mannosyltransferase
MSKRIIPYCTLLLIVLTSTILAWAPFILKGEFSTIYKHFDGPLYIIPAKTAYNPEVFKTINREPTLPQNPLYYAAHLPLYPFFIYVGSFFVGYLKSMIGITLISTIVLSWFFYYLLKKFSVTKYPLILTSVFLFLPRFLVVRTVGSPEPLFMVLILGSLLFFEKRNYFLAGLLGGLATMTKSPGILLFPAYFLVLMEMLVFPKKHESLTKKFNFEYLYLFLIPLGLLTVFGIYAIQFKDFFAYFHSGDNIHLAYPYAVFNTSSSWVGTAWLEDILFYFALYIATIITLWSSKQRSFFYFGLVFLSATLFVQHRDISRYSLPLWPLACIAFEHVFTSKKAVWVSVILITGIYMYAWNFLGSNVMPISEWLPFL